MSELTTHTLKVVADDEAAKRVILPVPAEQSAFLPAETFQGRRNVVNTKKLLANGVGHRST